MPDTTNEPAVSLPTPDQVPHLLQAAVVQIRFARDYVNELLAATDPALWFDQPAGSPSNIAWQVGHLTVSQYGLLMFRLYGRRDSDLDLVPSKFRKTFGKGSDPHSPAVQQYSVQELQTNFAQVYQQSLAGLVELAPEVLLEPVEMPYAGYPIKLGAVLFCPLHEMLHAGQIGLTRRLLGLTNIR